MNFSTTYILFLSLLWNGVCAGKKKVFWPFRRVASETSLPELPVDSWIDIAGYLNPEERNLLTLKPDVSTKVIVQAERIDMEEFFESQEYIMQAMRECIETQNKPWFEYGLMILEQKTKEEFVNHPIDLPPGESLPLDRILIWRFREIAVMAYMRYRQEDLVEMVLNFAGPIWTLKDIIYIIGFQSNPEITLAFARRFEAKFGISDLGDIPLGNNFKAYDFQERSPIDQHAAMNYFLGNDISLFSSIFTNLYSSQHHDDGLLFWKFRNGRRLTKTKASRYYKLVGDRLVKTVKLINNYFFPLKAIDFESGHDYSFIWIKEYLSFFPKKNQHLHLQRMLFEISSSNYFEETPWAIITPLLKLGASLNWSRGIILVNFLANKFWSKGDVTELYKITERIGLPIEPRLHRKIVVASYISRDCRPLTLEGICELLDRIKYSLPPPPT